MPKNPHTSPQPLRPRTLRELLASAWNRGPNTFIARWDTLKAADLPSYDLEQEWLALEAQIRRLKLDEAHGDVIDRLVQAHHDRFVAQVTTCHLDRSKAIDRVVAQGQWHYIHLQKQVDVLRARVAAHRQQAEEAWMALTGQDLPGPIETPAAGGTPLPVPNHAVADTLNDTTGAEAGDRERGPATLNVVSNDEEIGA